jgi:hypothetical protein
VRIVCSAKIDIQGAEMKMTISAILILAAGLSREVAKADFTFGMPTNLGPTINSGYSDSFGFMSADGLELYLDSGRPPGTEDTWDLWVATRATTDEDWGTPVNLGPPLNTSYDDFFGCISADGLELYFCSNQPGGSGHTDLWVTRRRSRDDVWEPPVNLGPVVNSSTHDYGPCISADGLELYFNSTRDDGFGLDDLYVTTRTTIDDAWGAAMNLGAVVNSPSGEIEPRISADGLCLFFSDHICGPFRPGGFGGGDIWVATRTARDGDWGLPVNLGPWVNTAASENSPRLSHDGSTLYFSSTRPGGLGGKWGDIWQTQIIPVVDFNGDGMVDFKDLSELAQHWQQNERSVDIAPPIGDGIVDVHDLAVLAEYWLTEF